MLWVCGVGEEKTLRRTNTRSPKPLEAVVQLLSCQPPLQPLGCVLGDVLGTSGEEQKAPQTSLDLCSSLVLCFPQLVLQ